jgi:hypothetical protein
MHQVTNDQSKEKLFNLRVWRCATNWTTEESPNVPQPPLEQREERGRTLTLPKRASREALAAGWLPPSGDEAGAGAREGSGDAGARAVDADAEEAFRSASWRMASRSIWSSCSAVRPQSSSSSPPPHPPAIFGRAFFSP